MNLTREELDVFGKYLSELKEASDNIRDDRVGAWLTNRKHINNEPTGALVMVIEDAQADMPFPCASSRKNALADYVSGAIFSAQPIATCTIAGESQLKTNREKFMEFMVQKGRMEESQRSSMDDAWCTNHQITRIRWDQEKQVPVFEPIPPQNFICTGFDKLSIQEALMVGHIYPTTKSAVEAAIAGKVYDLAPDNYKPMQGNSDIDESSPQRYGNTEEDAGGDHEVELAQVIVYCDCKDPYNTLSKKRKEYLVDFDASAMTVLKIQDYTYALRWYFSQGFKEYQPFKFWADYSLGTDMQGPHIEYNLIMNTLMYGAMFNAFRPSISDTVAIGMPETEKRPSIKPGGMYQAVGNMVSWYPDFNASILEAMLPVIERAADDVARISPNAYGATTGDKRTATEVNEIAQGTQQSINGYVTVYSRPMLEMFSLIEHMGARNFTAMQEKHGAAIGVQSAEDLMSPCDWEINGKNSSANPIYVRNAVKSLTQDLAQIAMMPDVPGLDKGELMNTAVSSYRLPNGEEIFSKEEYEAQLEEMMEEEKQAGIEEAMNEPDPNQNPQLDVVEGMLEGAGGHGGSENVS